ncbi:MAG: hypothetical protein HYU36_12850 [Planctomycetes bacterium]|nr:hypothetical protein [Planctomycetota bacterium]
MLHLLGCCAALYISLRAEDAPQEPPRSLLDWWPPDERPPLREVLHAEDYSRKAQPFLAGVDWAILGMDSGPILGMQVYSVTPMKQADLAGVKEGEYLASLPGGPIARPETLENFSRMLVHSVDGQTREVQWQPGRKGLEVYARWWWPEVQYLREQKRDPAWEKEMIIATALAWEDPDLAETALARAVAKGFPRGVLLDLLAAAQALNQARFSEAMSHAWFALQSDPDSLTAAIILHDAAVADFKLKAAAEMVRKFPGLFPRSDMAELGRLIADHRGLPAGRRDEPPPSVSAARRRRRSLLPEMFALNENTRPAVEAVRATHRTMLGVEAGSFIPLVVGPAVKNAEIELRFKVAATDREKTKFARVFGAGWIDLNGPKADNLRTNGIIDGALALRFWHPNRMDIRHGYSSLNRSLCIPHMTMSHSTTHHLRMILFGGRSEILLDGKRLLDGPSPVGARLLAPFIKTVGMNAEVWDIEFSEILEIDQDEEVTF